MTETVYTAGLYCRLSKEDKLLNTESMSIDTQKKKLTDFSKKMGIAIGDIYIDDGLSGVFFDRPDFERMMTDVRCGKLNCVIVKDLSRLGRSDAESNRYYEDIFLTEGIRFIAIDDNVDTLRGFEQIVPFMNMFNAMYPRDISNKTRSAYKTKAEHGEFLGSKAPYGYQKSPADKHKLVVDEETAPVVRHIFDLVLQGYGRKKIAKALREEKILTPAAYAKSKGNGRYDKALSVYGNDCMWSDVSVGELITNEVYIGNCVNHKQSKPFKSRKVVDVPKKDWIIVKGTHEPIITQEVWSEAQKLIQNRRRPAKDKCVQIFSGLVKCKDCGRALTYNSHKTPDFMCSTYRSKGKELCSAHRITYNELYTAVMSDIYHKTKTLERNEECLRQAALHCNEQKMMKETKSLTAQLEKYNKRIRELDVIIKKTYENNVLGALSNERFAVLLKDYEQEQAELKEKVIVIQNQIDSYRQAKKQRCGFRDIG